MIFVYLFIVLNRFGRFPNLITTGTVQAFKNIRFLHQPIKRENSSDTRVETRTKS
jgi:hypothetical protein